MPIVCSRSSLNSHCPYFPFRYGAKLFTRCSIPFAPTSTVSSKRFLARLLFLRRKCDLPCVVRINLPLPPCVRRKRLVVDLCDLIFGILFLFLLF